MAVPLVTAVFLRSAVRVGEKREKSNTARFAGL
jgi:hypothetical protein